MQKTVVLLLLIALAIVVDAAACDCDDNAGCTRVICVQLSAAQAPPTMQELLGSLLVANLTGALTLHELRNVSDSITVTAAALSSFDAPTLHTVGGALQITGASMLTSVSLPALVSAGSLEVSDCAALVSLTVGQLARTGDLSFRNLAALPSLSLPLLATSGALDLTAAGCTLFSAPVLALLTGSLQVVDNAALSQLSLPALASVSHALVVTNNAALSTLSLHSLLAVNNAASIAISIFSNGALCSTCSLCPLAVADSSLMCNPSNLLPLNDWSAFSLACSSAVPTCDTCPTPSASLSPSPSLSSTMTRTPTPSMTATSSPSFSAGAGAAYTAISLFGQPGGDVNTDYVLDTIEAAMLAAGVPLATVGLTATERRGHEYIFTMRCGAASNAVAFEHARAFRDQLRIHDRIKYACTPMCTVSTHVTTSAALRPGVAGSLLLFLAAVAVLLF